VKLENTRAKGRARERRATELFEGCPVLRREYAIQRRELLRVCEIEVVSA
jgi:hypothetical protein